MSQFIKMEIQRNCRQFGPLTHMFSLVILFFFKFFSNLGTSSPLNIEWIRSALFFFGHLFFYTYTNVWIMSYSKHSNWQQILKLLSNFGCLFTFCYYAWENQIKTKLQTCSLKSGQSLVTNT